MKVVGVLGGPRQVERSLSPAIHNAALRALELNWVYVGLPVAEGDLEISLPALVKAGIQGFNVTMPHKVAIVDLMDRIEGEARAIGSVNTVEVRAGELIGSSTDGEGFTRFLLRDLGLELRGASVAIIGAGGAARAVVAALSAAGVKSITVLARRKEQAQELEHLAIEAEFVAQQLVDGGEIFVESTDLIVNATPLGQAGDSPPLTERALTPGMTVVDLVYRPAVTPLMRLARKAGAAAHGGLGMLLHQAALSFQTWTGIEPPLAVMSEAALAEVRSESWLKRASEPAD